MKLFVTGSSDFLGKNFLLKAPPDWEISALFFGSDGFPDFLKEKGLKNVTPVSCDLSDFQCVQKTAKDIGSKFDAMLYLAGNRNPGKSISDPLFDLDSNVRELVNFLENFSCEKFIYLSTGAVYGSLKGLVSPGSRVSPTLPYAISRLTAESYVRFFQERRKSIGNYVILRFFDAYGPLQPSRKLHAKLVETFVLEGKKEFTVFGDGESYIDSMYIDDAVEGLRKVLETRLEKSVTVDFGTGNPLSINEFVKEVARIFGVSNIDIKHTNEAIPEYISFRISPHEMERLFSFKPTIKLGEGINKLAQHLKANPES